MRCILRLICVTFCFTLFSSVVVKSEESQANPVQTGTPRGLLIGDYQKKRFALVDVNNNVRFEQKIGSIHDAHLLENGNILFQTNFRNVIEMTPDGNEVWRYEVPMRKKDHPDRVEIHAFQRLENGRTLIAESGKSRLIEVDAKGRIVLEVPLQVGKSDPHRDTRLVRKTAAGTYLAAQESDNAVKEYDANGKVIWSYDVGSKVYSAERLKNGNTLIGTGDGHSVVEVNSKGETVWKLTSDDLDGIELAWITMVERLPNGNTFVVNCHAGPKNPQLLIVTPEKKVVWTFLDFDRFGNSLPVARLVPEVKTLQKLNRK